MNCDQAFDLMTDPHESDSAALRAHLAACPRCRQMSETLAPALDWLSHTAQSHARDTPSGEVPVRASHRSKPWSLKSETLARRSAARLSVRAAVQGARVRRIVANFSRGVALILAGFALALIVVPGARRLATDESDPRCTRRDAAAKSGRNETEIQALIADCSRCHKSPVRQESALRLEPAGQPAESLLIVFVERILNPFS